MCRTPEYGAILVALLAEGVDRNIKPLMKLDPQRVALLAEGVDIHCHCLDPRSAVRNSRSLPMI